MSMQVRRLRAEGRGCLLRDGDAHSSFIVSPSSLRLGVTLVELLITITIISILSAAFLGTSNLAMESSREARTKTTIGKIHGLLMEKWSEYSTRRVDIDTSAIGGGSDPYGLEAMGNAQLNANVARGQLMAGARLQAIRTMMRREMPDRWSDITNARVNDVRPGVLAQPPLVEIRDGIDGSNYYNMALSTPAIANAYLRRYNNIPFSSMSGTDAEKVERIERNQGAECLYMTIMLTTADGEARTLFSEQDIGDTDDDGAPEFLDGWGRPINYIRWPAGFAESGRSFLTSADAINDHDPFDYFRLENPTTPVVPPNNFGYRLVPLIYSAGSDGEADLFAASSELIFQLPVVSPSAPYAQYTDASVSDTQKLGTPFDMNNDGDDNSLDNIHNHLQDNR